MQFSDGLKSKIYEDISEEIWRYYKREGIKYSTKASAQQCVIDFFTYLCKLIPAVPRKVYFSDKINKLINEQEVSEKIISILKDYKKAFEYGQDMNIFLSNNTKEIRKPDFFLFTWHLYHLHMSGKFVEDKAQMKNNRSDTLLICIVNETETYFVDIIEHPKCAEDFFDIEILKIIAENKWMDKIGYVEIKDMIPGSLQPKITEKSNLFELYSKGKLNASFEFDGKGYCPLEPMSRTRHPSAAVQQMLRINRNIFELGNVKYNGFRMEADAEGMLCGIIEYEDINGNKKSKDIFR